MKGTEQLLQPLTVECSVVSTGLGAPFYPALHPLSPLTSIRGSWHHTALARLLLIMTTDRSGSGASGGGGWWEVACRPCLAGVSHAGLVLPHKAVRILESNEGTKPSRPGCARKLAVWCRPILKLVDVSSHSVPLLWWMFQPGKKT